MGFGEKVIRSIYDLEFLNDWWLLPKKQGVFHYVRSDQQTMLDQDDGAG
jgi:hypothetical protein